MTTINAVSPFLVTIKNYRFDWSLLRRVQYKTVHRYDSFDKALSVYGRLVTEFGESEISSTPEIQLAHLDNMFWTGDAP